MITAVSGMTHPWFGTDRNRVQQRESGRFVAYFRVTAIIITEILC